MRNGGLDVRWPIGLYLIGAVLIAVAVLPEFLSGSAPGFGPMQIAAAAGAAGALCLGTFLWFRTDRLAARRQMRSASIRVGNSRPNCC